MKQFILTFLCCATLGLSFSQLSCNVHVTNTTGQNLAFGVQSTTNTLNVCPTGPFTSVGPIFIPIDAGVVGPATIVLLGTVIAPAPPIRAYRLGCYYISGPGIPGSSSWQISTCWSYVCPITNAGDYTITVTSCSDYDTFVTIS
jgi:hypothetical protein